MSKSIRIWYQSYVDYDNGKTYWDRLRTHLDQIVDPGTTVDIKGISPHDNYAHAIVEFRCAREVICNAVRVVMPSSNMSIASRAVVPKSE